MYGELEKRTGREDANTVLEDLPSLVKSKLPIKVPWLKMHTGRGPKKNRWQGEVKTHS